MSESIESRFARTNLLTFLPGVGPKPSPALPAPPPHPLPTATVPTFIIPPFGYDVGRITAWGVYMNWCPVEGHLWTSREPQGAQFGDGVVACADHDGWPNAGVEEDVQ
jgi:hypothetical protein